MAWDLAGIQTPLAADAAVSVSCALMDDRGDRANNYTVVDLFSGCGGLSLGFWWAGFEIAAAVELDAAAAATHHTNFGGSVYQRDIREVEPGELLRRDLGGRCPDVLVGGPPCQAFARIGRAKLRAVASSAGRPNSREAHLNDPRVSLSQRYLHFVEKLRPRALLMENVPDILNHGGNNLMEGICAQLDELGYEARYTILNAVHFGVPQYRERMFLLAYRRGRDMNLPPTEAWWPSATHTSELPRGYYGTRAVAKSVAQYCSRFDPPIEYSRRLDNSAVSASHAFSGLPILDAEAAGRGKRYLAPSATDRHSRDSTSDYGRMMQSLPTPACDNAPGTVSAHVTRHLPRDFAIFREMQQGQDYVGHIDGKTQRTCSVPEIAEKLNRRVPYDPDKFPNKWWKLRPDHPSRTLTAHIGKDTYSHIHFSQARTISVREAARLQSFPDAFSFSCSMNAGFRMVGNAVPPLLAEALAATICSTLDGMPQQHGRSSPPCATTSV